MAADPKIRTPIVCVMGHVDHGKTSLLDRIRGSSVVTSEAGAITQHIGATIVPIEAIRKMSGSMEKIPINIPGLLFIDTPGHHAFTTLRARGGALADMAILVVDISQGFQPQTVEALQILRNCKTPFVIAATKIDRIHGWRINRDESFLSTFAKQNERVKTDVETKTYEIVGKLSDLGFSADRYDRVSDFRRNLAIVPVSAHTGEGIADLLMVMIGLAQRYLGEELRLAVEGPGAGTVLEVKEERGLGTTLDVILYDGTLCVGDEIAMASQDDVVVTKVRSLLKPHPLKEILVEDKFEHVKSVAAAAGIKVSAPGLEKVIAGSPLFVVRDNLDELAIRIRKEMQEIHVNLADEGIVIKADTIGALEALCKELETKEIKVMRAEVGPVSRHDLIDTETIKNPTFRVLLSFNTPILPDAAEMIKDPLYTQVKGFLSAGDLPAHRPVRRMAGRAEADRGKGAVRARDDAGEDPAAAGLRVPAEQPGRGRGPGARRETPGRCRPCQAGREESRALKIHAAPAGDYPRGGRRPRSGNLDRWGDDRPAAQRGRRPAGRSP